MSATVQASTRAGLLDAKGVISRTASSTRCAPGTDRSVSMAERDSMRRHSTSANRWSFELK